MRLPTFAIAPTLSRAFALFVVAHTCVVEIENGLAEPQIRAREAVDLFVEQRSLPRQFAFDGLGGDEPVPGDARVEHAVLRRLPATVIPDCEQIVLRCPARNSSLELRSADVSVHAATRAHLGVAGDVEVVGDRIGARARELHLDAELS
jgi:hypothetical protein